MTSKLILLSLLLDIAASAAGQQPTGTAFNGWKQ